MQRSFKLSFKLSFIEAFITSLLSLAFVFSCGSKQVASDTPSTEPAVVSKNEASNPSAAGTPQYVIPPSMPVSNPPILLENGAARKAEDRKAEKKIEEVNVALVKNPADKSPADKNESADSKSAKPIPPAASSHHETSKGVDPATSLGWLQHGNTRFIKSSLRKDGQSGKDIARLSKGQAPHAIVLSCSDSRVPPEIVFDQKLGELFVVRTAGEALDSNAIGSIEYAIEHLGSRLLVVMGHTSCGAVRAAVSTYKGGDAGSEHLNHLVADIHPRLKSVIADKPSDGLAVEGWANAKGVAKDLMVRSKIISEAVNRGKVRIVASLYHLDSGKVDFD